MKIPLPLWMLCFPALLGLACGSFLNVCIVRLPQGKSVMRPGSQCPQCGAPIRAWQNIPVLSWLLLRGRCRSCSKPIPIFYPLVETVIALWFVFCTLQYFAGNMGPDITGQMNALSMALLGWLLVGLFMTDLRDGLLPNSFTLGGGVMALLLLAMSTVSLPPDKGTVILTTPEKIVLLRLVDIFVVAGVLLLLRWLYRLVRRREGIGLGDVKMTAMLAAFLGWELTLVAFLAACIVGSAYAAVMLLLGRPQRGAWAGRTNAVPFGSFLAIGGLYAIVAGNVTLQWYMGLLR